MMAEAILAGGYWVIPSLTAAIWLLLHLSLRFGSAAMMFIILCVQTVIALSSAHVLTRMNAANSAVEIGTVALVIPICILLYLKTNERRREALEIASIRQARFIAHVGHDLGQPLNATRLLIASLNETPLSADQRAMVGRLGQSVEDTAGLFRAMLDVSMLDSDSIAVSDDLIAVGALLRGLAVENAASAKRAGVIVRLVAPDHIIRSDRALLGTMLQNLISNVIRHAPGSRMLLGARVHKGLLSIEVHDTGPGIPAGDLPRVFDEFSRVSRDKSGAGLGLSIVRRLGKILRVDVKLASREGRGTSVSMTGFKLETH
jgi:signal transduction histidine kinase